MSMSIDPDSEALMSDKPSRKQVIGFLLMALAIIVISIVSTLYMSGVPVGRFVGNIAELASDRYRHITLADAQTLCEERARATFGERIRVLSVDTRSSRLDKRDNLFKVFMEAELYQGSHRQGLARHHFINCFTHTDREHITLFQYARDGEQFIAPGEEARGLFGI